MKTIILKFAAFLLFVLGSSTSCEEKDPERGDVSFTQYSLVGTSCHWANLAYGNEVIVINSKDDLERYMDCEEGDYSEVDFSKQTLLLASGEVTNGIEKLSTKLLKQDDEYVMEIEVALNDATVMTKWETAILVYKLNEKAHVELNVTVIRN